MSIVYGLYALLTLFCAINCLKDTIVMNSGIFCSLDCPEAEAACLISKGQRPSKGFSSTWCGHSYMHGIVTVLLFVGCCLATKDFVDKLAATGGVWVIIG